MSVLPRCICDPLDAMTGKYDPRCSRHFGIKSPLARDLEMRAALLGMVLKLCRDKGMSVAQVQELFSPDNIAKGFQILEPHHEQP